MALITDPDSLSQGTITAQTDLVVGTVTSRESTLTATATLPAMTAGDFFEIRDHSDPENNGLWQETGGSPTTSSVTATKISGVDPIANAVGEATRTLHTNATAPDEKSVMIDVENKQIWLIEQGSLTVDGVTGQAVYSFLKEEWKTDADLIPHTFPMTAVGTEKFEFIAGWRPQDNTSPVIQTRKLIRTAGWSELTAAGVLTQQYAGVVTLGTLAEATDQPYYQLGLDPTDTTATTDFTFADATNEAVLVYDNVTPADAATGFAFTLTTTLTRNDAGNFLTEGYLVGGSITIENAEDVGNNATFVIATVTSGVITSTGFTNNAADTTMTAAVDNRTALRVFSREPFTTSLDPDSGKTFAAAAIIDTGFTSVDNQVYRFPLSTSPDLKITNSDATIAGAPYNQIVIKYFDGVYSRDVDTATNRSFGIVIDVGTHSGFDGSTVGTSVLTSVDGGIPVSTYDSGVLTMLSGADEGTTFPILSTTATTVTVTGTFGSDTAQSFSLQRATPIVATAEQIYEKVQFQLRQQADIDDQASVVTGDTAAALLRFVGDTLITLEAANPNTGTADGVMIEGFDSNDTNRITFTDNAGATFTFPFVAAGTINFNSNLVGDTDPEYWMFFEYTERFTNTGFGLSAFSGDTATLDSSVTDLTAELANNDYITLTGFTNTALDGVYVLTGAPAGGGPYTATVRRVDGTTLANEAAGATVDLDKNPINSPDAIVVNNNAGSPITGAVGAASIAFDFDYDGNVQGGKPAATDAAIVIRAIGLELGQFAEATGTITRATGLTFSVVAALERNYSNP